MLHLENLHKSIPEALLMLLIFGVRRETERGKIFQELLNRGRHQVEAGYHENNHLQLFDLLSGVTLTTLDQKLVDFGRGYLVLKDQRGSS